MGVAQRFMQVRMFGDFFISYGDVMVGGEEAARPKVWNLLAYVLFHHSRMIPKEELLGLFGGSNRYRDPAGALRALFFRMRKTLEPLGIGEACSPIIKQGDAYGWNPDIGVELDAERFENLCREGDTTEDEEEKLANYRTALQLFHGAFLDHLSEEEWVIHTAEYYRQKYLELLSRAFPLLQKGGYVAEMVSALQMAVALSPYHEAYYRMLMQVLMDQGEYQKAEEVYRELARSLREDLDTLPEGETQKLHHQAEYHLQMGYIPPEQIRQELEEQGAPSGALICDFTLFKLLYRTKASYANRWGNGVHIAVLTVTWTEDNVPSEQRMEQVMEGLRGVIQSALRLEDVASRCSTTQYVLMLSQINEENSEKVCRRVVNAFKSKYHHLPVRISRELLV